MAEIIQYSTLASHYDGPFGSGHPWLSAGMGYLILTKDSSLIAIDGGHPADAENFLGLIEETSPTATVDAWIITHPHIDHFSVICEICEKYSHRVKIKKIIFRFPDEFRSNEGEDILQEIAKMEAAVAASGAEKITPSIGDTINVGSCEIKFLFTPEDAKNIHGKNPLSLIFSVSEDGRRALFTGDAYLESLCEVWDRFNGDLKFDVLQLPHHGLCDTGHRHLYTEAAPETVLIPTSKAGYHAMLREEYADYIAKQKEVELQAKNVYKSFEGTVRFTL